MSVEVNEVWNKVISRFGKRYSGSKYAGFYVPFMRLYLGVGAEFQPPTAEYLWNGIEREGPNASRWFTFQWTIEGEGILRIGDKLYPQKAGQVFLVPIPSDHEYRVVKTGPGWKFFYLYSNDKWVTERVVEAVRDSNFTFTMRDDSRLGLETLRLISQVVAHQLDDHFDAEKGVLNWMIELERHIYLLRHPEDASKKLLSQADAFYQVNKHRSFGVEDFAEYIGMSRARASIFFKKTTGLSPASYFTELRLKEATMMLSQGYKLQTIADATGFADSNHFGKVFRRFYHMTPGQFRRMHGVTMNHEDA